MLRQTGEEEKPKDILLTVTWRLAEEKSIALTPNKRKRQTKSLHVVSKRPEGVPDSELDDLIRYLPNDFSHAV